MLENKKKISHCDISFHSVRSRVRSFGVYAIAKNQQFVLTFNYKNRKHSNRHKIHIIFQDIKLMFYLLKLYVLKDINANHRVKMNDCNGQEIHFLQHSCDIYCIIKFIIHSYIINECCCVMSLVHCFICVVFIWICWKFHYSFISEAGVHFYMLSWSYSFWLMDLDDWWVQKGWKN